jgi:hypothetical protein
MLNQLSLLFLCVIRRFQTLQKMPPQNKDVDIQVEGIESQKMVTEESCLKDARQTAAPSDYSKYSYKAVLAQVRAAKFQIALLNTL